MTFKRITKFAESAWWGPGLISVGAFLWATDALFRVPTLSRLDPTTIVFFEHLIAFVFYSIWYIGIRKAQATAQMRAQEWIAAAFVGIVGSALATILFTTSFRYINPSVTILIQKLQPIIVIGFAHLFLGEQLKSKFIFWSALALGSSVVLNFPDFDFKFLISPSQNELDFRVRGWVYAFLGAFFWALSTVAGKILLRRMSSSQTTYWRYFFALIALLVLLSVQKIRVPWEIFEEGSIRNAILYMSLIPGLLSLVFYYAGLQRTSASTATLVELVFPVSAVVLNTLFLNAPLSGTQMIAAVVLLFSVTQVSRHSG